MSSLAQKFRDLFAGLHAHHDVQAVEHFAEELLTLEGRVAQVEQLVRDLVPGAAVLPQLPDLTPTHDPVSGLPLQDPASARTPGA